MAQNCIIAAGCTRCLDGVTDCVSYPMFTSPAAQYFGYDNGYSFAKSFRVGISTNQDSANFTLVVSYSTNGGGNYQPYGTINVIRPNGGILDYSYGSFVNFNFSTIEPVNTNFYLKITALPNTMLGAVYSGNPVPRIQIILDAYLGTGGTGGSLQQTNTRFSLADATDAPTTVNAVCPNYLIIYNSYIAWTLLSFPYQSKDRSVLASLSFPYL